MAGRGKTAPAECTERWVQRAIDIRENTASDGPAVRIRKLADVVFRIAKYLDDADTQSDYKIDEFEG